MFLSINRASVPFGIWASALPVRASTASRANVNLNILFIELPGEATARLSTSPSFAGARATVRQKARLPLRVFATRARCPHCVRFTPTNRHREREYYVRKVPGADSGTAVNDVDKLDALFDHLVDAREQHRRDGEAERTARG